jgi:hypothetical protein
MMDSQAHRLTFAQIDKTIGINHFPAYYRRPADLTAATRAYLPRQNAACAASDFLTRTSIFTAYGGVQFYVEGW